MGAWGHPPFLCDALRCAGNLTGASVFMGRQLPGPYWTCDRKLDRVCYRSVDGRFEAHNNWSVQTVREPNWLLIDLVTGKSYRLFLRTQVERQIETLLASASHTAADAEYPP